MNLQVCSVTFVSAGVSGASGGIPAENFLKSSLKVIVGSDCFPIMIFGNRCSHGA